MFHTKRPVEAVLFDLYGTLVDIETNEEITRPWREVTARVWDLGGDGWTPPALKEYFARQEAAQRMAHADIPDYEADLVPIYETLLPPGLEHPREAAEELAWRFRQASTQRIGLYPGALELLAKLRKSGRKVLLVSNAQSAYTRPELQMLGLADAFDHILISSEVGRSKPSAEIFRQALELAGCGPDEAVMVGNDPRCDIEGAAAARIGALFLDTWPDKAEAPFAEAYFRGPDYGNLFQYIDSRG